MFGPAPLLVTYIIFIEFRMRILREIKCKDSIMIILLEFHIAVPCSVDVHGVESLT